MANYLEGSGRSGAIRGAWPRTPRDPAKPPWPAATGLLVLPQSATTARKGAKHTARLHSPGSRASALCTFNFLMANSLTMRSMLYRLLCDGVVGRCLCSSFSYRCSRMRMVRKRRRQRRRRSSWFKDQGQFFRLGLREVKPRWVSSLVLFLPSPAPCFCADSRQCAKRRVRHGT